MSESLNWHRNREGAYCSVPRKMGEKESKLFRLLHEQHCASDGAHICMRRITVDVNGVTMQCPLCGDARKVHDNG